MLGPKKQKIKLGLCIACALLLPITTVSFVHAGAWAVADNASQKSFIIYPGTIKHTITYYLPTAENSSTFTSHTLTVDDGVNLYDSLSTYTTAVGNYSFDEWHLGTTSFNSDTDKVATTEVVSADMTVYAKYVRPNVLYYYDNSTNNYVYSSTSNVTLNTNTVSVGTRIYSWDGVFDKTDYDLTSESGKYSFYISGTTWSIKRVVQFDVQYVSSWWLSYSAHSQVYLFSPNVGSGDEWTSDITFTNNIATVEVDSKYTKMILVRLDPNGSGWDNKWNQTVDIMLTGSSSSPYAYSGSYSSTTYKCQVWTDQTDSKNHYGWVS